MLGVSLGNVSLLRLDRVGGPAPGNKSFKLSGYLLQAGSAGISRFVSFGGAWSNHLHALAAAGHLHGFDTVGIVRGEPAGAESAMLGDARRWGMRIVYVSREEYRRRHEAGYQVQLAEAFAPCLVIPEGGASAIGAGGCKPIADMVRSVAPEVRNVVVPVGSGTTLAGLVANLDDDYQVHGISALKGAFDLDARVQAMLQETAGRQCARWSIRHEFHCGGFARVDPRLREFIDAFEAVHGVPLDPVYTAKMLLAIHQYRQRGEWAGDEPVLAVHTGGLQGRRGYAWLSD